MSRDDIKAKAISGAIWTVVGAAGQQVFGFIVFTMLARNITPAEFGTVAVVAVIIEFLNVFGRAGLTDVLIYRSELSQNDLHTAFWLSCLLGAVASLVLWAAAPLLARAYSSEEMASIVHLLAISVFIFSLGTNPEALIRREFGFRILAARSMTATIISGVIALALIFYGAGVYALVFQRLIFVVVNTSMLWFYSGYVPRFSISIEEARRQLYTGVWLAGSVFVSMATPKAFDLIIGSVLGLTELGFYRVGSRYLDLILDLTIRPLSSVALSSFSALQGDAVARNRAYLRVVQITALVIFPAFAGAALVSSIALPLLFGTQWRPSVPLVHILAFTALPFPILFHGTSIFTAIGRGRQLMALSFFDLTLSIIVAAFLAPWGLAAVAIGYVARACASVPLFLFVLGRHTDIRVGAVLSVLVPPGCATACMLIAAFAVGFELEKSSIGDVGALCAMITVGIITYVIALAPFRAATGDLLRILLKRTS